MIPSIEYHQVRYQSIYSKNFYTSSLDLRIPIRTSALNAPLTLGI